ncbi:MAG: hypothetical protein RIT47_793 [Pseudomonadota bacterium]|jgi:hypothetical protein
MVKVFLETANGDYRWLEFANAEVVRQFVDELPKKLKRSTAVRVECDLLGIGGIVRGIN